MKKYQSEYFEKYLEINIKALEKLIDEYKKRSGDWTKEIQLTEARLMGLKQAVSAFDQAKQITKDDLW